MSQDYINEETTYIPHSTLTTNGGHFMDENSSKIDNNKQPSTLDFDSILKSFFQPGHDTAFQQDQTVNHSNPSSRRHSVAVGELDLHGMMDPTWFDQPAYPVDDLNFSSALSHLHQYGQQEQQQYHPNHPNHHHHHRRAMSMQQSDGFLSQAHLQSLSNKDTLAEFHPPSSFISSSEFGSSMVMNMDLFNPPNDVVPTWLLSHHISPSTTTTNGSSCSSSSPPPSGPKVGNDTATNNLHSKIEGADNQQQPKRKRQKNTHSSGMTMTTVDSVPTPSVKQETSPMTAFNQLSFEQQQKQQPQTHTIMTHDAIRSFIHKYLTERYGERTVMLLTSRVAQKSYGTEKRFLCPPPTTILSGSWCIQTPSTSPTSSTTTTTTTASKSTTAQPRLMIQISGEATQQAGTLEWSTLPPPVLPTSFPASDGGFLHSSSTVGKCVSKHLHINDADEKRKRVQVMVNIQLANKENIGTFASKGIKVISKPSKKRQSLKNIDLCIHHGTTISLFNRIRSQTVSTKYLGVSSQPSPSSSSSSSSPSPSANNPSSASNCCFVARTNVWDPFVIWIVDPQRTQQPPTPSLDSTTTNTNAHYPPPPAMALHHTGKEQLAVHYNQPVVLQCLTTGLVSPVMTIRKVDKGSLAQSGAMIMEPTSSTVSEALGDPVSQLHKVAFQIQTHSLPVKAPNTPSSPSHSYHIPPAMTSPNEQQGQQQQQHQQQQQQQQQRNIFLACLNDVVGRHKCLNPPRRLASTMAPSAVAYTKTSTFKQQKGTMEPSANGGGGGRRRSSAASSLDQIDLTQGAHYEQDVSDAAVWTIVGTDCVRYTFAVPPPSTPHDNNHMRPDIAPFPVVSSISQGESTLCLWGESLTSQLTVYVGDHALVTEFKSPEALVCVIPPSSPSSPDSSGVAASKKWPILLVRKDGVIYKTNHTFCLGQ